MIIPSQVELRELDDFFRGARDSTLVADVKKAIAEEEQRNGVLDADILRMQQDWNKFLNPD